MVRIWLITRRLCEVKQVVLLLVLWPPYALGSSGYERMVQLTTSTTQKMIAFVEAHPTLSIFGNPTMNLIAFESTDANCSVL